MNCFSRRHAGALLWTVLAHLGLYGASAATVSAAPLKFEIAAGDATRALNAFGAQTGLQMFFEHRAVEGRKTQAVSGQFEPQAALALLLRESGLTFKFVNERTVSIRAAEADRETAQRKTTSAASAPDPALRLALAQSTQDPVAQSSEPGRNDDALLRGTPEILVKGKRSVNADIERTADDIQPYVVFDREQIQRSQATNLEEFFKTRLPMNAVERTSSQSIGMNFFGNQSAINLRGLGTKQTLILVDGRRMPEVNTGFGYNQPDINGIPMSIIERIEILPSTASGIYGGGATGGVINIITRKDYAGVDVSLAYGNTFESDVANRRIDANTGISLENGRTQILLAASHSDSNPLLVGERGLTARGRALQLKNNPAAFYAAVFPPLGRTSNIRSNDGSDLVLNSGAALHSPITYIPDNYAGTADGGAALVANAGKYNLDLPEDLNGGGQGMLSNPTVESLSVNLRRSMSERLDAFVDLSMYKNDAKSFYAGIPSSTFLEQGTSNNPFSTDIVVSFPVTDLSIPYEANSDVLRATGGVIVRLPRNWTASADHTWSRSRVTFKQTAPAIGDPDGILGPQDHAEELLQFGVLDVMRDLNAYPLDYTPYLLEGPNSLYGPAEIRLADTTLRLSGPVFRMPGGPAVLSGSIEHRKERALPATEAYTDSYNFDPGAIYYPATSQTVDSYYMEMQLPLIAAGNARSFAKALEFQVSVRNDQYSSRAPSPSFAYRFPPDAPLPEFTANENNVEATKYTFGLRYSPLESLMLRASVGTGFLAPGVEQIVLSPAFLGFRTVSDPKRGSVPAGVPNVYLTTGGNPNLRPEESRSWSAGMVLTPRPIPGLRLSIDYTRIDKTDEISAPDAQLLVNNEELFPGRITRAALTGADIAAGYTGGRITAFDLTSINMARKSLEAWDLRADYGWKAGGAGEISVYTLLTWQPQFMSQILPAVPFTNSAGLRGGPLEWRGNIGANWDLGGLTLGWNMQFFDSYGYYFSTSTPAARNLIRLNQGSLIVPGQTYHDAFARYRFAQGPLFGGLLENLEFSLGIQNLFNQLPPAIATTGSADGYSRYGDPRLRRYTLTLRKSFD